MGTQNFNWDKLLKELSEYEGLSEYEDEELYFDNVKKLNEYVQGNLVERTDIQNVVNDISMNILRYLGEADELGWVIDTHKYIPDRCDNCDRARRDYVAGYKKYIMLVCAGIHCIGVVLRFSKEKNSGVSKEWIKELESKYLSLLLEVLVQEYILFSGINVELEELILSLVLEDDYIMDAARKIPEEISKINKECIAAGKKELTLDQTGLNNASEISFDTADYFVTAMCCAVEKRNLEMLEKLYQSAPYPEILTFPRRSRYFAGDIKPGVLFCTLPLRKTRTRSLMVQRPGTVTERSWIEPSPEIFNFLCKLGVDINAEFMGHNCLDALFIGGILDSNINKDIQYGNDIPNNVAVKSLDLFCCMCDSGIKIRISPSFGITPYACCVYTGWKEIAQELLYWAEKNPEHHISERIIFEAEYIRDFCMNAFLSFIDEQESEFAFYHAPQLFGALTKELLLIAHTRNFVFPHLYELRQFKITNGNYAFSQIDKEVRRILYLAGCDDAEITLITNLFDDYFKQKTYYKNEILILDIFKMRIEKFRRHLRYTHRQKAFVKKWRLAGLAAERKIYEKQTTKSA